jgi:dienelactone hydrolase
MTTDTMRLTHAGAEFEAIVARPQGPGPHPAVMVMHSALGLRHMVADKARALAELGYLAIATDMYGVGADTSTPQAAGQHYMHYHDQPQLLRDRCVAWFNAIAARDDVDAARIAAIGYCFGGRCTLELARSGADVKAAVSYHGILTTHAPAQPGAVKGEVSVWCGLKDPFAPLADIDALRAELSAAGAHYHIAEFADAEHGFTDPEGEGGMPGIAYNAIADRLSWAGTVALLGIVLA